VLIASLVYIPIPTDGSTSISTIKPGGTCPGRCDFESRVSSCLFHDVTVVPSGGVRPVELKIRPTNC
jgi:hypothetical protein